MITKRCISILAAALMSSGCGLQVPNIQEVGGPGEGQRLVQAILINIKCELREALTQVHSENPAGTFLDNYGIETTLTLTHDEKGTLAPGVSWMPSSVFTLGAGLTLSSEGSRKNVIDGYYLVSDLQNAKCSDAARVNGVFLLQSDLKLTEWLRAAVSASLTRSINFDEASVGAKDFVLQHQVTFTIISEGTITPSWKLKTVSVNPNGNFLTLNRTRTHDLVITFGPASADVLAQRAKKRGSQTKVVSAQPGIRAANLHFTATLSSAIGSSVKSALQP